MNNQISINSPMISLVWSALSSHGVSLPAVFLAKTQARMRVPHVQVLAWQQVSVVNFVASTENRSTRTCTTPDVSTVCNGMTSI
jgi:hypothetical protein